MLLINLSIPAINCQISIKYARVLTNGALVFNFGRDKGGWLPWFCHNIIAKKNLLFMRSPPVSNVVCCLICECLRTQHVHICSTYSVRVVDTHGVDFLYDFFIGDNTLAGRSHKYFLKEQDVLGWRPHFLKHH